MRIRTGKGTLPLITVIAILSLSLVVNLPGLAVSPMLGTLEKIFPDTTQLEVQLLTMLPNLLIIPCLLLSGHFSLSGNKTAIVTVSLIIYAACGVAYLFARSMAALIVISCALGIGAGLLIPFSTGLIADAFSGPYRMQQMGFQSAISNMTLVCATFVVGWLSGHDWHMPFLVYLIPLVPLALTPFLRKLPKEESAGTPAQAPAPVGKGGIMVGRLLATMGVYFFITYAVIIISYYAPFVAEKEHLSSAFTGTITSIFFLFVFLPGFFLPRIIARFGSNTVIMCAAVTFVGLGIFAVFPDSSGMIVGAILMGIGYGTLQPLLYDKATFTTSDPRKATLALAFILSANYLAIVVAPFIVDFFRSAFHASDVLAFSFILNCCFTGIFIIVARLKRKSFIFTITEKFK